MEHLQLTPCPLKLMILFQSVHRRRQRRPSTLILELMSMIFTVRNQRISGGSQLLICG